MNLYSLAIPCSFLIQYVLFREHFSPNILGEYCLMVSEHQFWSITQQCLCEELEFVLIWIQLVLQILAIAITDVRVVWVDVRVS